MMKQTVLIVFLLSSFLGFTQEPPKMPKYNAKNAAGIFYYDDVEASKKIKLKNGDKKLAFSKAIRNYNSKIKDISFLNMPKLSEADLTVNAIGEKAFRDRDLANKVRKVIEENVFPVRDSVIKNEKHLNSKLESLLNKKQYKKWLRYQRNEKEKLLPERPKTNQSPANNGMMNRNRMGGLGGRRF